MPLPIVEGYALDQFEHLYFFINTSPSLFA